jgi:hypothetical protein
MATASTRGKNPRSAQPVTLLLWQDALVEWVIPVILISALVTVSLLGAFEQIPHTTGVLTLGCLLLLLVAFLLFKPLLMEVTATQLKALTWAFAAVWVLVTCIQLYAAIFVGEEIGQGGISTEGAGLDLTLGAPGTVYDLVVEGNFANASGEGGRAGGYLLLLTKDGQKVQEFSGTFTETTARQRLGRRGSTVTHRLHNHVLQPLVSPGEGAYHLTLTRIDPQLSPTLQVALYRDTYPEKTFWLLSVLLLIGAYIGEIWYAAAEPPLVLVTAAAVTFVLTFRHLGVPPHTYQDIIGAFMVAAILGPIIGWIFHVVADIIAKKLGYTRLNPVSAVGGKGGKRK